MENIITLLSNSISEILNGKVVKNNDLLVWRVIQKDIEAGIQIYKNRESCEIALFQRQLNLGLLDLVFHAVKSLYFSRLFQLFSWLVKQELTCVNWCRVVLLGFTSRWTIFQNKIVEMKGWLNNLFKLRYQNNT